MYQNNYNGYAARPVPQGLKGRPVSSLEEVRAAQIDFDGSIFFFPDIANGKIYTKQINLDGTASLNMYSFAEVPKIENQYVTREEFNETLSDIRNSLDQINIAITPKEEEFKF